jgi:hypothetical protein
MKMPPLLGGDKGETAHSMGHNNPKHGNSASIWMIYNQFLISIGSKPDGFTSRKKWNECPFGRATEEV